jgi:hypothetical protein
MIASSGGIVQPTSPGHQNSRSLPASAVHGTRHGSLRSPTAPPASRTEWGPAGRLIRPRLADLVSPRARSGAAAAGLSCGSPGHFRRCSGDFRGRLLRRGGPQAGLVVGFYPRQRHVVGHRDWAVPRVSGTRPAVFRGTSAEDYRAAVATAGLVADFYPRHRHVVWHGDWAVPRVSGTLPAIQETSAEDRCAAGAGCPGDFRGRLLRRGGPRAGLVAGFYPCHRHPRRLAWSARWVPGPGV